MLNLGYDAHCRESFSELGIKTVYYSLYINKVVQQLQIMKAHYLRHLNKIL